MADKGTETIKKRQRLLLHICCAVCTLHPLALLLKEYDVTLFYYNPNIHPETEYRKRLEYIVQISRSFAIPIIKGDYNTSDWFEITDVFKDEPEGGKRCGVCFEMRLEETAKTALLKKFDIFSTTLTISPHKNSKLINKIGEEVSKKYNILFYDADFKKKDGFKKTIGLSNDHNIYRQDYCGCIYSKKPQ